MIDNQMVFLLEFRKNGSLENDPKSEWKTQIENGSNESEKTNKALKTEAERRPWQIRIG